jgi:hypothetical protein
MSWVKWEDELLNLNRLSRISDIGHSVSAGRDKGKPEIRLYADGSSAILVKTFQSLIQAQTALQRLEEDLIKNNYETGGA